MQANTALKIFVVDDDQFCRTVYKKHLQNSGYANVSVFDGGHACLDNLVQQPDIIFLDYEMEVLNGLQVLKLIKHLCPEIYVVFVSGQADVQTAVNSIKQGAFDYVTKGNGDTCKIDEVLGRIIKEKEQLANKQKDVVF